MLGSEVCDNTPKNGKLLSWVFFGSFDKSFKVGIVYYGSYV